LVGLSDNSPFITTLSIPNRVLKGFHTLSAVAYDDVRNRSETTINVNLTAPAGELGLLWQNLYDNARISQYQFPYSVRMSIPDYQSVEKMTMKVLDSFGQETVIGSVDRPSLPNMSFEWPAASAGNYSLMLVADLVTGDQRTSVIHVSVE
jgi:hypothetical protein